MNGARGKFYEAEWIPRNDPPIMLVVLDPPTAEREASFYFQLQHHHIIDTFGLVKNDQQWVMLVQERASHGDLQSLLSSDAFQPTAEVLKAIFLQIVDAMIYLTTQNIVHGDLCCENILVFQMNPSKPADNLVKLTGFSLARKKDEVVVEYRLNASKVRYSAPELLVNEDGSGYSEFSDVYSMGVLMWVACSKGAVPYGHRTNENDVRQRILHRQNLSRPTECPKPLWEVIKPCWMHALETRSNFEYLKRHLSITDVK